MKKIAQNILILGLLFLLALFQQSFVNNFSLFGRSLNIYLIIVFILVFFSSYQQALVYSALAGLMFDLFSLGIFGLFTLSFLISSLIVKKVSHLFNRLNIFSFLVLLILFFACYRICFGLFSLVFSKIL